MCNRYRADIKKAGLELERYGYEEFSETRIRQEFPQIVEDVFPDKCGLVARLNTQGKLEPAAMRWGFEPPPQKPGERKPALVTNVRNTKSSWWKPWLKTEYRCIVPATSFSEWDVAKKGPAWFEPTDGRVFGFAGIWRPFTGIRGTKKEPHDGDHLLYAFLTTDANAVVAPIHSKAMPVILPIENWDAWLTGSVEEALEMQKPAPDNSLFVASIP